jgi:hypothetical protein
MKVTGCGHTGVWGSGGIARTGVGFLAGERNFFLLRSVHTGSGVHLVTYSIGTGALSPGGKRPDPEANHSSPSSTELKNPTCLNGLVLNQ